VISARRAKNRFTRLGVLAVLLVSCALAMPVSSAKAEEPFDAAIRADILKRKSGLIAHVETVYNDIFVRKYQNILRLSFQVKGWYSRESEANLADPEDLPMLYSRVMSVAAIYPPEPQRVLVLGVGGGSIPIYLHRYMPEATIDAVDIDPGVIDVAKKYFGLRETSRLHLIESDGRVFLKRNAEPYDIIMLDAFLGSYIPFHMMTTEFYQLVRSRLKPHGVVAINILPVERLFPSNVRTLQRAFDHLDFFNSGDATLDMTSVIVLASLDASSVAETAQKATAAQSRYKFRFDVARLVQARRIATPGAAKGEVLTDDYAPADVFDAYGRRQRRQSRPADEPANTPQ
jgi:spermidine synthase